MKDSSAPGGATPIGKNEFGWALWVMLAAFGSYFCMYGFRKPFTAGLYQDSELWGLGFKTVLVTCQVMGYMLSKFIGIKVISEIQPRQRLPLMVGLMAMAELALILFGLVPRPWNAACLFLNGLTLGMIFGLILGFLEGRRLTELLAAGLCASFILADGVTKTVGTALLRSGVTEEWMPSVAGGIFLLPLAVCIGMLSRIQPPSPEDIQARSERQAMDKRMRRGFIKRFAWGLFPILLMYLVVTIVRSIRADFAPEIWQALGYDAAPSIFTYSEMLVAVGVLSVNGAAFLIVENRRAFFASLATCAAGFALITAALLMFESGGIAGFAFMVMIGLGLYLPYVAMHTTVFERLLAMTREIGNIGFLMYVADSLGYLGYVVVMITRNFLPISIDLLTLLQIACWSSIVISGLCLATSVLFFRNVRLPQEQGTVVPATVGVGS